MKNFIVIFSILSVIFVLNGCAAKNASFNPPDKMTVFGNNKQQAISKDEKSYKTLYVLSKDRLPEYLGIAKMEFSKKDVNDLMEKGLALEFTYNKAQSIKVDNGDIVSIQYNSVIFPLNGEWKNIAFLKDSDGSLTPIGLHGSLSDLVNAMTK